MCIITDYVTSLNYVRKINDNERISCCTNYLTYKPKIIF